MGEHLPCKQGVKSSNLSVSIEYKATSSTQTAYLENFIQRMILRKDFQKKSDIRETNREPYGNHTVIIKKRYNAIYRRSSKKEHRADALALRAEERRDKLRKAMGRSKYPLMWISEWGNPAGQTPVIHAPIHNAWRGTR